MNGFKPLSFSGSLENTLNSADYRTIAMAVQAFDERALRLSGEDGIAARVGLSREHLNTLFEQWAGVGLTRFMHCLTLSHTRQKLLELRELMAGLPSSELDCQLQSPPSEHGKKLGEGLTIKYGLSLSPFGDCLLAMTSTREICHLSFVDGGEGLSPREELCRTWPRATIIADDGKMTSLVERIFSPDWSGAVEPLRLLVKGTTFQLKVWRALLALPQGAVISYQGLAASMGQPTACRAVASAVAANPVGYLIPCHRVVRKSGEIHHYRWGNNRKKMMLGREACVA